jgi:FkbM family methyltransferase
MKALLKRLVIGTRLEPLARRVMKPPVKNVLSGYDAEMEQICRQALRRDSCCIDVGCHKGIILDMLIDCAPTGLHIGVEPLPGFADGLRHKYAGNPNITIVEAALAEEEGETTFQHVTSNAAYSGLRRRTYARDDEAVVEINVKISRLDDLVPDTRTIDLIKIDVEGAELGVLLGGRSTIDRCKPLIVFEHGLGAADHYGTKPEMVLDVLTQCGLQVSLMSDWLASRPALTREGFVDEFNSGRNYYFLAHPPHPIQRHSASSSEHD